MSQQTNHWLRQWEDVFDLLRRNTFRRDSRALSARDNETWAEALLLTGMLLEDLTLSTPIEFRRAKSWCCDARGIDCLEFSKVMKEWDGWLLSVIERPQSVASYVGFKRQLTTQYSCCGLIISPVAKDLQIFLEAPSTERFRVLHQFFTFMGRTSLKDIPNDSVIEDFVLNDEALHSPDESLSTAINRVLREWLSGFRVAGLPTHGPGSTADAGRVSLLEKYRHLGSDQMLDYVCHRNGMDPKEFSPCGSNSWERIAKLQCVPKTALTQRTICMEPATLQYYQQMVRHDLYEFMHENPKIRRHINLIDQSVNRSGARLGSQLGDLSTIDLSKASDSVTWDLTRKAFAGTTLLPWLYATRSSRVEVRPGEVIRVKKFAPMGSALCFPIECLIFAALCEVAVRDYGKLCSSHYYTVYGDDIVIDTNLVPILMSYLELTGFTVNRDKSFTRCHVFAFRESCGGEYLGGEDVSPLRIPRRFQGGRMTAHHPDKYQCYVDLANSCYDRGLVGCRRWLINRLHSVQRHIYPAFGQGGQSLTSDTASNFRLIKRWNRKLQCYDMKHGVSHSVLEPSEESAEKCRLYHWFLCAERDPDRKLPVTSHIGSVRRPTLESVWTPAHWL